MRPVLPQRAQQGRTAASTSIPYTTVTADSSANSDGAWVQLIAATTIEASEMLLTSTTTGQSGVDTSGLLDIYIGDGSQNPVAPLVDDFQIGYLLNAAGAAGIKQGFRLPVRVPFGVEVIARVRSATASRTYPIRLDLVGGIPGVNLPAFHRCRTYGAVTATSRGTALATPGGNNAKGAWTELSAAVTETIYGVGVGPAGNWLPGFGTIGFFYDIGVGSAGNEVVVVPDMTFWTFSSEIVGEDWPAGRFAPLMRPIAAGERLVARQQTQNTGLTMNLIVYGYS